jgi:NADH-quinone oxidoreductase subunit L
MRDAIDTWLMLIPALPLAAAVICGALGPKILKNHSHWPVILAFAGSFVCSLLLLRDVYENQRQLEKSGSMVAGYEHVTTLWRWAAISDAYEVRSTIPGDGSTPVADQGWRNFTVDITLRADALTSMMLCMVTFVASLVAIFAAGYMHGDRGYWRFFAYIGIFVFSMTMLVSVSNFVLLFVFWEAVGACSYLLIGFWYQKPEAAAAGKKAFLVNRVGDFGFLLGLFLIWSTYGTLNFHDARPSGNAIAADSSSSAAQTPADGVETPDQNATAEASIVRGVLGQSRLRANDFVTGGLATAICLLLMLGACGKSAQFPLHVWLPDAMEGPTPVSALIHAATMVTAGVYMVTRCSPLFSASPEAQLVVAIIGGFTALLAGLIALTQFDLKRVLAYSTVSQLGYMFLALGAGTYAGITSGMYHLFTHAFFKALLFLGAGSVMHAMGNVIDMRQFGGLRKLMPHTHWTFLIGSLALAGIFPFSGFWSKDAILGSVHDRVHAIEHEIEHRAEPHGESSSQHHPPEEAAAKQNPFAHWSDAQLNRYAWIYEVLYYSGIFTAFLTAFYTFRAVCMTFYGEEKIPHQAGHHAHESPPVMVAPLAVLAIAAALVGLGCEYGSRLIEPKAEPFNVLTWWLGYTPSLSTGMVAATRGPAEFHLDVAAVSTVVAVFGILLAMYLYLGERTQAEMVRRFFDWEGLDRITDPQWVTRLEQVRWIGAVTRPMRRMGLGFVVTFVGYLLGLISLLLAVPLAIGNFVTPYKLSYDKFFFDQLYDWFIVKPLRLLAAIAYWFDRWIIDGVVNLLGWIPAATGALMRSLQMGLVQFYALAMVLGAVILIFARLMYAAG